MTSSNSAAEGVTPRNRSGFDHHWSQQLFVISNLESAE